MTRIRKNAPKILKNTMVSGIAVFVVSYGGLYLAIRFFPELFIEYISPVFNSDGSRDVYFYLHPFILTLSLSVFWSRFGRMFEGNTFQIAAEFSVVYTFVALVPILWITYSAMEVGFRMVATWIVYGLFQCFIAGFCLTSIDPQEAEA